MTNDAVELEKLAIECQAVGVPRFMIHEARRSKELLEAFKRRAIEGYDFAWERNTYTAQQYELAENFAVLQAKLAKAAKADATRVLTWILKPFKWWHKLAAWAAAMKKRAR